jgi:hypothetical protein
VLLAMTIAASLLLAACGGDDDSSGTEAPAVDEGDPTTVPGDGDGGDTGADGDGECFVEPGDQTARVRYVNLFTNDSYPEGELDIWEGFGPSDGCGEKLATVPYGTATDYIEVNARDDAGNWETTAYIAGESGDEFRLVNQTATWLGGEQVTIVFTPADPSSAVTPASGTVQAFYEISESADETFAPVDGQAVLGIGATALQYTLPDEAWVPGIEGVSGCVLGVNDTDTGRTLIAGTQLVVYQVDPGPLELSLHPGDPATCSGPPDMGPVTVDAQDGSRTLVFAYGTSADDLDLLVLPVDE